MVSEGDWPDALVPVRLTEETVDPGGSRDLGDTAFQLSTAPDQSASSPAPHTLSATFTPPLEVPPGETLSFLLDLYLPADAPATPEDLRIILSTDTGESFVYTIRVEPYPFTLPSTSSLRTAFGFTWPAVAAAHERLSAEPFDAAELHREYLRVLSEHRISVYNPQFEPVKVSRNADGRLEV